VLRSVSSANLNPELQNNQASRASPPGPRRGLASFLVISSQGRCVSIPANSGTACPAFIASLCRRMPRSSAGGTWAPRGTAGACWERHRGPGLAPRLT
jgi:hypothetical protein